MCPSKKNIQPSYRKKYGKIPMQNKYLEYEYMSGHIDQI